MDLVCRDMIHILEVESFSGCDVDDGLHRKSFDKATSCKTAISRRTGNKIQGIITSRQQSLNLPSNKKSHLDSGYINHQKARADNPHTTACTSLFDQNSDLSEVTSFFSLSASHRHHVHRSRFGRNGKGGESDEHIILWKKKLPLGSAIYELQIKHYIEGFYVPTN